MSSQSCNTEPAWYVIHTNPRQEERADSNLRAWNVETFIPRVRERRFKQFTSEPDYLIKPLFSRYIFARFDLNELLHKVRYTRGVTGVVDFGEGPIPVSDEIINMIRTRTDKNGFVRIGEDFNPGDEVVVSDGPLKDLRGVFERQMKESDRVVVLLNAVSYQAHVEIDESALENRLAR